MSFLQNLPMLFVSILWLYMTYKIVAYIIILFSLKKYKVNLKSISSSNSTAGILALLSSAGLFYYSYANDLQRDTLELMWGIHIPWLTLSVIMPFFKNNQISFSDNNALKVNNGMDVDRLSVAKIGKIVIRRTSIDIINTNHQSTIELDRTEFKSDTDWKNLTDFLMQEYSSICVNQNPEKKRDIISEIMSNDPPVEKFRTNLDIQSEF